MTLRIRIPAIFFPVGSAFGSLHKYNNYFYYFITVMVEDTDNSHSWIQILKLDSHQSQAGSATLMREYLNLTRCIKSVCLRFWASRGGSPDYGYHTGRVAAPAGVDANPDPDARVKKTDADPTLRKTSRIQNQIQYEEKNFTFLQSKFSYRHIIIVILVLYLNSTNTRKVWFYRVFDKNVQTGSDPLLR